MRARGTILPPIVAVAVVASAASALVSGTPATGARDSASGQEGYTATSCSIAARISSWSTARLAAQTLAAGGNEDSIASLKHEEQVGIGGIVLFGNSAPTDLKAQLTGLNSHALAGIAPFFMTDEEGGQVQRMANLVGQVPAPRVMGATMNPSQIETLALTLGRRLRAAGVTMDLAPVLDVDGGVGPNARDPDGTRSFSPDVAVATADGLAFARGLQRAGVVAVAKHFPGLGGATGNTDDGPAATVAWSALQHAGLKPFQSAIQGGVSAVMVANATVPGLTSVPASLSATVVTKVLRDRLGFRGLVMTDSLSALAIRDIGLSIPAAAVEALLAGEDLVLFQSAAATPDALTNQVIAAVVGAVSSGTLARTRLIAAAATVLAAKHVELCPIA